MADAEAEAAFLHSMQAMNESVEAYTTSVDASGEQIDSSDEYDPAQNVQDLSLPDPPDLSIQAPSAESSNTASYVASVQGSPAPSAPIMSPQNSANLAMQWDGASEDLKTERQRAIRSASAVSIPVSNVPAQVSRSTNDAASKAAVVPASALSKTRLPHDRIGILEDRIKEDEKGDMDAWMSLIAEHRKRGKLDEARKVYDMFFKVFPSAAEQWVALTQMENEAGNRSGVEAVFNRTLADLPSLQLWSTYLDHIRRYYNVAMDQSPQASRINHAAYNTVLDAIGIDKDSGKIWQEFIQYIKAMPGVIGGSNWQDQQKMDVLRKAYSRAICIPTQSVEAIWKEYSTFEMGLNKITGRKFLQDRSPAYMSARSSYTELQNITRDLKRTTLPVLPPALGFDGDVEYAKQVDIWKRWIQWEKDDPLVLKEEDLTGYKNRVVYVYKQALMALRFWPETWYDAAEFCFNNDLDDQGDNFLTNGVEANPESCLLTFKRADRIELSTTSGSDDESKARRGKAVREPYDALLETLYQLISKAMSREAREISRIEAASAEANTERQNNGTTQDEDDQEPDGEELRAAEGMKNAQIESVKAMYSIQVSILNKTISHAWIALMRAMQRVQGKGKGKGSIVGGSRQIFKESRLRGRITSDVWIASAMLEYHSFDGESAKRIFEHGVKWFPEDEKYALEYIKHLIATNDHTNARVVFETAVGRLAQKPENTGKAKTLYAFFHDFESRYGELGQIVKLEKRIRETFPYEPRLASFSQRFVSDGFDPTAIRPIISPMTQARPKMMATIETVPSVQNSPAPRFIQAVNSPKRSLPFEETEDELNPPRKLARGESPLKGAAGRRLDQLKRSRQQQESPQLDGRSGYGMPPPPLPRDVLFLLSIIPPAHTYHASKLNPEAMVKLIQDTNIPSSASQIPSRLQPLPNAMGVPQTHSMPVPQAAFGGQYMYGR